MKPIPRKNPSPPLWTAICILALAIVGGWWVMQREINHPAPVQQASNDWRAALDGLSTRVDAQASNLKDWSQKATALDTRVTQMEGRLKSGRVLTSRQAAKILKPAESKMEASLNKTLSDQKASIESRLKQIESNQRSERTQMAQLQKQQDTTHQQLATLRTGTNRDLNTLRQAERRDLTLATIKKADKRENITFEASRKHLTAVEPGIELTVQSTDPDKQQYSGFVTLLEDRSVIWIKNQDVQVPVMIQPKAGGPPLELVVNRVNDNDVTGVLMFPESDMKYAKAPDVVADWAASHPTNR